MVASSILLSPHPVQRCTTQYISHTRSAPESIPTADHHTSISMSQLAHSDMPLLETSDSDTMSAISEGSLATVVDKSGPHFSEVSGDVSKVLGALPEGRPRREQKMYPCLKTHRYDRGTTL